MWHWAESLLLKDLVKILSHHFVCFVEEGLIFRVDINENNTIAPSLSDLAFLHNRPIIFFIFPHQQRPKRLYRV
jgi:hypothetical protein